MCKIRGGFFANNYEHVLFHHHKEDGSLRYKYPLIQYKIIDQKPVIISLETGCDVVINNFLDIDKLKLNNKVYNQPTGRIKTAKINLKVIEDSKIPPFLYTFITPWLGLNQSNYKKYKNVKTNKEKSTVKFLSRILIGNILAFAKGIDWWIEDEVVVIPELKEIEVQFKGNSMVGFIGKFYSNVYMPELIGLGKSSSRGFGTIKRKSIT